jgi:hypothetical protein
MNLIYLSVPTVQSIAEKIDDIIEAILHDHKVDGEPSLVALQAVSDLLHDITNDAKSVPVETSVWALLLDGGHYTHSLYASQSAAEEARTYIDNDSQFSSVVETIVSEGLDTSQYSRVYRSYAEDDGPVSAGESWWGRTDDLITTPGCLAYEVDNVWRYEGFGFSEEEATEQLEIRRGESS